MLGDKVKDFEYSKNWRFDETSNEDSKVVPKASGVAIARANVFETLFHAGAKEAGSCSTRRGKHRPRNPAETTLKSSS